jgi:hypothetical protein
MAVDAGKLIVDRAGLNSGADSSRQAGDHAHDGVNQLSGASVSADMFGGFPAAGAFAEAVNAAHGFHMAMLQSHQTSLANLGDQVDNIAATFTETENRSAATLKAVRCNSST